MPKEGSGLCDRLFFRGRDTWLAHQGFYMATAQCMAYIASKLGKEGQAVRGMELAMSVKDRISRLYLRQDGSFHAPEANQLSPGPEMSLYSRIVPGDRRCDVLQRYFDRKGQTWPGSDENVFVKEMPDSTKQEIILTGEITKRGPL